MKFKHPIFLLAFVPLVLVLARSYFSMIRGQYAPSVLVPWKKLWAPKLNLGIPPRFWHCLGYAIGCSFLIIALARPQTSFTKVKRNVEGIDIMLVLDLSASMRIEDFRNQSRIDVSKDILQEFIRGRQNDKIGFQGFSGEPITLVPPTVDYALLLDALKNIEIGDIKDGTAIGDALAAAVGRLKESTAKSRIIILLTDGDSNVGQIDPLTGGELAKGYGIKIYSIAIGREGRVAMPFVHRDIFGRNVKTYQYFDNSINPELLKKISEVTGGKFYRVEDNPKLLRQVFSDIDQLERRTIETTSQVKYDERFSEILKFGLAVVLLTFFLQATVLRVYP